MPAFTTLFLSFHYSKLGKEQTKLESNSFLLEERQQQEIELVKQLEIYKKMNEDSKRQYEDSERRHKQEIVAFEKKAHENWVCKNIIFFYIVYIFSRILKPCMLL